MAAMDALSYTRRKPYPLWTTLQLRSKFLRVIPTAAGNNNDV